MMCDKKRCENCYYARLAYNEDYIACVAMITNKLDYTSDTEPFYFYERDNIDTGWAYLSCRPNSERFGMMTNGIPCFKRDDCCKHYEEVYNNYD